MLMDNLILDLNQTHCDDESNFRKEDVKNEHPNMGVKRRTLTFTAKLCISNGYISQV